MDGSTLIQGGIFLLLTLSVALFTYLKCRHAPRDTNDSRDYFLAGGGLSWLVVAGSMMMTNISAEQIVGMNGAQTLLIAWWEIAAAIGIVILAKWLIPIYYRYGCTTTTELLERRYQDKGIRALVSLLFMAGYMFILLPTVLYTGSLFMVSMFDIQFSVLGLSPVLCIAMFFAISGAAYAIFGGLRAIAISDSLNGIGLLALGAIVTVLALEAIGWDLSGIPAERLTLIGAPDSEIPLSTLFTGMLFIQIFYWGTNMVITQRALAAKSVKEAQKGLYLTAVFKLLIPLIVVLPGIVAFKLYGDIGDASYGRLVADILPAPLSGAFAAVIFGAVLSSFNSCLNSAAALYTCDIHHNYIDKNACVKRIGTRTALVFTVVAVALVPVFAGADSIINLLQQLNGLYSMPVLAAFICALVFRNVHPIAIKLGMVFGVCLYAIYTFVGDPLVLLGVNETPLHFIHNMGITLCVTVVLTLLFSKLLGGQPQSQLQAQGQ
ncbi:solute:sodium symporter family transporter [Ferrimonas aestuarii]|uniref:Solute:sodium symporter family transporter n=1 Tax=Ferrimonas aestuarii TaxID=2569539 RepID=A0A4U1BP72_9GAMM|nr:solute:sodium symporter family transporter [Ferrimonas aestuarii]TKB54199.1 solute:sodium symporter family transporter [Ferrimonas aestuarii]